LSFFKKYALYGSAVAASLVLAVALLLSAPANKASAAISAVTFSAPEQASSLTETWTSTFVTGSTTTLTTIIAAFPTVFVTPATLTGVTVTGATITCPATGATSNGVGLVTISVAGGDCDPTTVDTLTVVIPGVTNGAAAMYAGAAAPTATTGFSIGTNGDAAVAKAAATGIFNLTATKSPTTSVAADGASTVAVTFTTSNTATLSNTGSAGALVYTVNTDVGTFPTTPTETGSGFTGIVAVTTPVQTVSAASEAGMTAGTAPTTFNVVVRAPTSPGTSTVIFRATPAGGGQAVIEGSTQITWIAATTQGAPASGSVTPAAPQTITQTGSVVLTFTYVDANGNPPIPGGTVTCTTTLGSLTATTLGAATGVPGQSISGSLPVGGSFTVTLTGGGLGGTATVTCTVNAISVSKVVTISGTATVMTLRLVRNQTATGVNAPSIFDKTTMRNTATTSTTSMTDEGIILAQLKDAAGNSIAAGSVLFTMTGPAGFTMGFTNGTTVVRSAQMSLINPQGVGTASCGGAGVAAPTIVGTSCTSAVNVGYAGTGNPAAQAGIRTDATSAAPDPIGKYTVTATYTNTDATQVTANTSFTLVKSPASVTVGTAPAGVPVGGTATLTFVCKDADGNGCANGTAIGINVANASLIAQDPQLGTTGSTGVNCWTDDTGVCKVTLIGVQAGTTQVVGNNGTLTAVATVVVGGVAPTATGTTPAGGTGTFDRPIPSIGVNTAIWGGGSVSQLAAAVASAGGISVTVFVNGAPVVLIPGAPDFVNAAFNAAFPTGVPAGTIVLVVK